MRRECRKTTIINGRVGEEKPRSKAPILSDRSPFGIDLATRDLRAQRIDQPAGANDQGIAVKAVLAVQP